MTELRRMLYNAPTMLRYDDFEIKDVVVRVQMLSGVERGATSPELRSYKQETDQSCPFEPGCPHQPRAALIPYPIQSRLYSFQSCSPSQPDQPVSLMLVNREWLSFGVFFEISDYFFHFFMIY